MLGSAYTQSKPEIQGYFLCIWLGTHAATMSQDVTDIRGERADFASGDRGGVIFYRFVFEGKGPLAFWEGALSLSKSPPKKSKRSFFEETTR